MRNIKIIAPFLLMFMFWSPAFAQSADLQAQTNSLLAQIRALQTQLSQQQEVSTSGSACINLSYNLYSDQTDSTTNGEVSRLQNFLAQDSSIYPQGLITGYFGPATESAVQRWQSRHGVVSSGSPDTTGFGYVGPKTRLAMSCQRSINIPTIAPTPTNAIPPSINQTYSPTIDLKVNGSDTFSQSVTENTPLNLSWTSSGVSDCDLVGVRATPGGSSGSIRVNPSGSGTYYASLNGYVHLFCKRTDGLTSWDSIKISTTPSPASTAVTPSVTLTANPTTITAGQAPFLLWNSTGVTSCRISGTVRSPGLNETENVQATGTLGLGTLESSATYTITCASPIGNITRSVTIIATPVAAQTNTAPYVITDIASNITQNSAVLNGAVSTNGLPTSAWFRYMRTTGSVPACSSSFGSVLSSSSLGNSTSLSYSSTLTNISAGSIYYYCAVAQNSAGTTYGPVVSFTTLSSTYVPPTLTLSPSVTPSCNIFANPNPVTSFNSPVTLNWNSQNASSAMWETDTSGKDNIAVPSGIPSINGVATIVANVIGNPFITLNVMNASGNSATCRVTISVPSPTAPSVTTNPASNITSSSATFNGSVNPNGLATTIGFRLMNTTGITPPACNASFGSVYGQSSAGSGTSYTSYPFPFYVLTEGKTYSYCAFASNSAGTTYGPVVSFNTLGSATPPPTTAIPAPPSVTASCSASGNITSSFSSPGATYYNPRIDQDPSSFSGICSSMNSGDKCADWQTSTSFSHTGIAGKNYKMWVHACSALDWTKCSTETYYNFSCPAAVTINSSNQTANVSSAFNQERQNINMSSTDTGVNGRFVYTFTDDLYHGTQGADVRALQQALNFEGLFKSEATGSFYDQTYDAVKAFQKKYGIKQSGYVGHSTRLKLNELYGR